MRVVDLAGDSLSLVSDARFPGLGDQLGVETGVLVKGRFELDERTSALLTELSDLLAPDSPEADGDGLDHDDDPEGPPFVGGRIGVDDAGVDDYRGHPDPEERERCRLQQVGVDESGDDEHEVDRQQEHEHRAENHQTTEIEPHPPLVFAAIPLKGEHEEHPDGGSGGQTYRHQTVGPGVCREQAEDEADGQGDVGHPLHDLFEASLPFGERGLGNPDHRLGAHSQRKVKAASTPAPIAKAAMTRRLEVEGASPDQVSCSAWTPAPVGVRSLTASSPSDIASRGK